MPGNKRFTLDDMLNQDVQPSRSVPKSENLDRAIAAATRLNVVEATYLIGIMQAELEAYRATIIENMMNNRKRE